MKHNHRTSKTQKIKHTHTHREKLRNTGVRYHKSVLEQNP